MHIKPVVIPFARVEPRPEHRQRPLVGGGQRRRLKRRRIVHDDEAARGQRPRQRVPDRDHVVVFVARAPFFRRLVIFRLRGLICLIGVGVVYQHPRRFRLRDGLHRLALLLRRHADQQRRPQALKPDPARGANRQQRKRPSRRPSPPSSSPHTAPLLAADVLTVYEAAQTGMTRDGAPAPEAPSFGLNFTPPSICSRTFPRSPCPPRSPRSPAPWSWHNCRRCSSHSAPAARPRRRPPAGKAAG